MAAVSADGSTVLRDPTILQGIGLWSAIQTAAPSFGIEVTPVNVRDESELERAVAAFARSPNAGLIVTGSGLVINHRRQII
jgi:putative ABC transport system substrate-binding protein